MPGSSQSLPPGLRSHACSLIDPVPGRQFSMSDSSTPHSELSPPVDLSHHLSRSTKRRVQSSVKKFYKYFQIPGIGQLAGGLPNQSYFPYDDLEAKVALPDRWKPTPNDPVDPPGSSLLGSAGAPASHPHSREVVPKTSPGADLLTKIDVATALQYGTAQGYPSLYAFVRRFTREHLHPSVPYAGGPEVILTCGATDGFSKAVQCFNNEWSEETDPVSAREGLLCEQYVYMNAIQTVKPRGMNVVPVGIDDEGMRAAGPGGLEDVLENWDFSRGKRPHLMYTVTIGQNPTSGTLSVQRRKELYALCSKYDVIIIEDDPYWYLQYPSSAPGAAPPAAPAKSSGYAFLDSLVPSYLSVDTDGRVVRLDTFSKTVAPGCRLGWITAQPAVVERILRITETSTQQPSGFVQAMIAELLLGPQSSDDGGRGGRRNGAGWEVAGWVRWLEGLRGQYERRMQRMSDILDEGKTMPKAGRRRSLNEAVAAVAADALEADLAVDGWSVVETVRMYDFVRPLGGMFLWVRFDFGTHPLARSGAVAAPRLSRALWVFWTTKPYLVLVAPGSMFSPTEEIRDSDSFNCFRLCFAAAPDAEVDSISSRFVDGARDFWRIKSAKKIDDLLRDGEEEAGQGLGVPSRAASLEGLSVLTGMC
ncbi:aromatic amino acid aminotransferase 1 [Lineolata rhizophorae]|uniref:Aromatic amino acid aminotransferase 1 n=1 Tax=Lineolata rhizophorae TaxID=578093 RepID=A0A6A6NV02_9PEZI|nr:aromatic amino acid aminotransferase 1 [Lineolata rhizophorae]